MIPFEGLLPFGIMLTCLTIGGTSLAVSRYYQNDYKRVRYNLDQFDRQMMERDFRLTGKYRAQIDNDVAPEFFNTNGIWKIQKNSWWVEG